MVQVDLNSSNFNSKYNVSKQRYTRKEVASMVKVIKTSGQVSLNGWMFCKYYHDDQVPWVIDAITDTLNKSPDTFRGLLKLKEFLKGGKIHLLRDKYGTKILKYVSSSKRNCIIESRNPDGCFIPLTASEILDLTIDIKKKRSVDFIMRSYDFYHDEMNQEYLERFIDCYKHKELNTLINFICKLSNSEGGFKDHDVSVIRNRNAVDYICKGDINE